MPVLVARASPPASEGGVPPPVSQFNRRSRRGNGPDRRHKITFGRLNNRLIHNAMNSANKKARNGANSGHRPAHPHSALRTPHFPERPYFLLFTLFPLFPLISRGKWVAWECPAFPVRCSMFDVSQFMKIRVHPWSKTCLPRCRKTTLFMCREKRFFHTPKRPCFSESSKPA
jgi:hypothetical protein